MDAKDAAVKRKPVAVVAKRRYFPPFERPPRRRKGSDEEPRLRGTASHGEHTCTLGRHGCYCRIFLVPRIFSRRRRGGPRGCRRGAAAGATRISTRPCRNVIRADVHYGCTFHLSAARDLPARRCRIRSGSSSGFSTAAIIDLFANLGVLMKKREKKARRKIIFKHFVYYAFKITVQFFDQSVRIDFFINEFYPFLNIYH